MILSPWHIQLLGGLCARNADHVVTRFRSQRTASLLAYLAFHAHKAHPREELIELCWPEADIEAGRSSLRTALSSLRRQLEPPGIQAGDVLLADRLNVQLRRQAIRTDVTTFETALQAIKHAPSTARRMQHLQVAVEAYGGPLLPGYYEDWIALERERLAANYTRVLFQLADCLQQTGHADQAIDHLCRAIALDPLHEAAHCVLMRLYVAQNQLETALRRYEGLEKTLRTELNVSPSAQTRALYQQIRQLSHTPSAPTALSATTVQNFTAAPLCPVSIPDDMPALPTASTGSPVSVTESPCSPENPPSAFGMPASVSRSETQRVRVPQQFTRFFGREYESEQLVEQLLAPLQLFKASETEKSVDMTGAMEKTEMLQDILPRLFTLTGAGGIGKTRLAIEIGRSIAARGVPQIVFVGLAEMQRASHILPAIAAEMELPPVDKNRVAGQVAQALQAIPTLLILDNFEHLLPWDENNKNNENTALPEQGNAATDAVVIIEQLRRQAPTFICLITSRQRLNIAGEQEFTLSPLPTPEYPATVERLLEFASVRLFLDRARLARPDFQITARNCHDIAALCQALEGIPLAIELMAAWAQTLTPAQMRQRLTQRLDLLRSRQHGTSARHRGLRACIEWSYRLLSPEQQSFFTRLAVFCGGWTLEAGEAVCAEAQALEYLTQLRERSLIVAEEVEEASKVTEQAITDEAKEPQSTAGDTMRYRLLESLREYAWEQLDTNQRHDLCRRHAEYFTTWAEKIHSQSRGPQQRSWLQRLQVEQSNIRHALAWCRSGKETAAMGLRLAQAVNLYWNRCGYLSEGRQTLSALLEHVEKADLTTAHSQALLHIGNFAREQGDYAAAGSYYESALEISRHLDNQEGIYNALNNLGLVALAFTDYTQARSYFEQCLEICRVAATPKPNSISSTLSHLGTIAFYQQDYASAQTYYQQALDLRLPQGSPDEVAPDLGNMALVLRMQGKLHQALEFHYQCLQIFRDLGMQVDVALELEAVAGTLATLQQPLSATRLFGAAETLRAKLNTPMPPSDSVQYTTDVHRVRLAIPSSEFQSAWKEGTLLSWQEAVAFAMELCDRLLPQSSNEEEVHMT